MNEKAKLSAIIFSIVFMIFFPPFLVMIAWNGFANSFNLPTFSYWHWFITILAIRLAVARIDFDRISES